MVLQFLNRSKNIKLPKRVDPSLEDQMGFYKLFKPLTPWS